MAGKRKKADKATTEQLKMYSALQEEAELARKAAEEAQAAREAIENAPTAQEIQEAQEAAEVMKEAQQAAEAYKVVLDDSIDGDISTMTPEERAAAIQSLQDTMKAQQEELQRLVHLPLSQIEMLPQEKRELVWQELARQLAEMPEMVEATKTAIAAAQKAAEAMKTFSEWLVNPSENSTLYRFRQWMNEPSSEFLNRLRNLTTLADKERILSALETTVKATSEQSKKIFAMFRDGTAGWVQPAAETEEKIAALQRWATLAPYITAEADEHPEKYGENAEHPADARELIRAAAARARADGKDIPPLKVEEPEPEQLEMDLIFPAEAAEKKEADRLKHIEETRERREQAQAEGTFETTSSSLATLADKDLGFSYFTSAVIKGLPGGIEMKDLMLDAEGKINLYDLTQQGRNLEEVDRIHTAFLMWLFDLAYNNNDLREINSSNAIIPVYIPAVLDKMGIDPRPRLYERNPETNKKEVVKRQGGLDMVTLRREKFMSFLQPFLNMAAWFGQGLYQIVGFYNYAPETETVYLTIPYLFKLVEYSKLHATKHGAIVNIFHADIMTENQTAVEVANRIAMGVLLRGLRPDAKTYKNATTGRDKKTAQQVMTDKEGNPVTVITELQPRMTTWAPKFSSLIKDCPQLQRELEEIKTRIGDAEAEATAAGRSEDEIAAARKADHKTDPQRTNKKLKDIFEAAIRIIMEKSDMPKYYAGFKIKTGKFDHFKAPTSSTLNEKLVITHKGKNPHFRE